MTDAEKLAYTVTRDRIVKQIDHAFICAVPSIGVPV